MPPSLPRRRNAWDCGGLGDGWAHAHTIQHTTPKTPLPRATLRGFLKLFLGGEREERKTGKEREGEESDKRAESAKVHPRSGKW